MYGIDTLIEDIYWCFIPLYCRDCAFVYVCRKGFWQGRKCHHGCMKIQYARRMKREEEREQYIDSLVKYVEEEEKHGRLKGGKNGR